MNDNNTALSAEDNQTARGLLEGLAETAGEETITIVSEVIELMNDNTGYESFATIRGKGLELFYANTASRDQFMLDLETAIGVLEELIAEDNEGN